MNHINQRLSHLQTHPGLPALFRALPFHTRRIVENLLESGVTFPLMESAGQCMHAEFQEYPLLQILANGDPRRLDAVATEALDEIEHLLAAVYDQDDNQSITHDS